MHFSTLSLLAPKKNQTFRLGKSLSSILLLIVLMIAGQKSWGQLLSEDFTGLTNGNLGGQNSWVQTGSGPSATVASASPFSYAGYNGGGGSYAVMPTPTSSSSRCYKGFTSTAFATNTFYYSALINLSTVTATGDYFMTLGDPTSGTVYFARLFARTSGAGFNLGAAKFSNVAAATWAAPTYNLNQTYLVVVRYTPSAGTTTDDAMYVWVNPATTSEPLTGSAQVAITAANALGDATGITNVGNFHWHNRTANNPIGKFDGVKVSAASTSAAAWTSLNASNTVNGVIGGGEYGTHTDGQNQNTNSGNVTYMNWDDNNLYVGVSGANLTEGYVLYLDKDPQVPVDGGTNANGTLIGQNYDGASFSNLPWRADIVMYVKQGYREYRTATGSNTWSSATASFGGYAESGTVREFSIPWSVIGGRPAAFNFFGYNVSSSGFVYNTQPTNNATGFIGTGARYERYYTVSTTTVGSSTAPFSRNSFVFNSTADENGFGAISVYDFTMNTNGRFISRTGQTTQNWSIAGNLVVGNGTIFFGSGGTNGAYGTTTVSGDLDIRGGTVNMDQTTSPLTVNGNLSLSSGTLQLSGNAFGGGDLVLKGNWSNIGGTFTPSSRAVFLNGTSAQSITKSGTETFDYLIVDNTANITAANGITVNQVLTLTNGRVGGGTVAVTNNATAAIARTNGYVTGNLQRAVATGTNTYSYPVGTASGYTPASIAFSAATGAGNVTVASLNGASSNYPPTLSATKRVARYWSVTNSGVSGFTADATFNYLGADLVGGATQSTVHAYKFDAPSTFSDPPFTSGANSFTVTGLSSFSEFGAGECTTVCQNGGILDVQTCGCQCLSGYTGFNCEIINRSITTSVTGTTFCAGDALTVNYNAISPVSWDPGNTFTAELSDASGSFASPVNIGSVSSTSTGLGSISATIPLGTAFGTGYRIRVVSSNPVVTGTDNGSDLTINANYTITATAGANGSISPNGVTNLCSGANQTYTITPAACYSIADVLVDGVSQGAVGTYTFTNVTANHTISASFILTTYTITVTAGANGSITPGTGSVNCGDNATYTITADACYSIADVVVDGVSQGAVGTYTFTNVTANHTISASFVLNTYTITVTAGTNGSITPATGSINCGDNATYTITADACYSIADVVVDGVSQGAVGTYTFTNVTANHTISASFVLNTYTITVTAGANGSITPGTGSVNCGDNATYTVSPDPGYAIADVIVDGVSQGAIGTYTFTNVTANHTISATFAVASYTITASAAFQNQLGSISPFGAVTVNAGDDQTFTITPFSCYSIANVFVDGVPATPLTTGDYNNGGTYTFTNVQANHTISVTWVQDGPYTITVTAGANGSIIPGTSSNVPCGSNQTYTISPDACYSIADVVVDGVSQGANGTYTFTDVQTNHTISATFSLNTFTITVTAGANGSITPGTGSVNCGDNATYTITADACYSIADVIVDGVSQGAVGTYTFTNVQANHTISATFVLSTYTITVTAGANGSITPGTGSVNCGDNATYTITADACYTIADVIVDGVSQGAVGTYTFTNVQANHTISASFVAISYTITVTAGANGSITPGTGAVECGDDATYTITADPCYSVADVIVDGVSQGAVGTYTFTNVQANHTISATFTLNTYTITVTAGANGSITPGTGSVNCGDNATYTITADACYSIADVIVDGVSQGAVGTYTFTNVTANHTISATFVLTTYTITVTAGANGSITPGTGSVNCGDNATYTITADACYAIADVVVDGVSQGAVGTYTFTNVQANHTISATFVATTYTITVTAGANGSITPGTGSVNCGDNATYTITADACYSIADVIVDGVSQGAVGTYTFTNVQANHTISATFSLNTYTITVTAGANGSITPGTGSVNCGDNATYTITADACYAIADVIVDGVSQGAVGTYTFTNVTANHTISATFALTNYTITVTAGANGSITPGSGSVNCGDNATYTITPDACYTIADVIVDGVSQGAIGTYTFTNVQANHTISASFAVITYTITVTAGANGSITPGTGSVNCGTNATYNITPIACYHIVDVIVDGVSQGPVGTYTFTNVQANHSISATFAINAALTAPVVSGPVNVCPYIGTGDPVTYTATSAGATGFTWVIPPTNVTIVSGQGTANLTVTFQNGFQLQGNKQLRVTALSACGNSPQTIYYLLAQAPGTPQPIVASSNNVCAVIGTAGTISYTIPAVVGATSYIWTAQAGTTVITHPNGAGPNDYTVNVSFTNGFTTSAISVQAVNGCGTSNARSLTITRSNPSTPGLISGPTNACAHMAPLGTPATYSVANVAGNTYNWTVPAGAIGLTGQGTNTISFTYPNTFTSGSITVTTTNGCGTSGVRSLSVTKLNPSTPSVIDVINTQPCPNRVYTYTIASMPANATNVQWTIPALGTLVSGQGTTSITVSYPATAVTGSVTAQAFNNCGSSSIRTSSVSLPACPEVRAVAKGGTGSVLTTPAETMQVNVFPNPTISDFKLKVITAAGKQTINVRILDAQGRSFKQFVVMPYQSTTIGSDLKAGAYILEVRQGNEVKMTKLLKF